MGGLSLVEGLPCEALTPPAPLSQRERGENERETMHFLFFPSSPLWERRGRGGEGFAGHNGRYIHRPSCERRAGEMRPT